MRTSQAYNPEKTIDRIRKTSSFVFWVFTYHCLHDDFHDCIRTDLALSSS
jgi:hypothetical protein